MTDTADTTTRFLDEVRAELERARDKFPDASCSLAALTEEVGELAKAMLQEPLDRVRAEAVQVAVMALRVAVEGDSTLDGYRRSLGLSVSAEED